MKFLTGYLLIAIVAACSEPAKQTEKTSASAKEKFDAIEKIVGTANWESVSLPEGDTSFMYFSRIGDASFNIYTYRIEKGDSVESQAGSIISSGDSVLWLFNNKLPLKVTVATDTSLTLTERKKDGAIRNVFLKKTDSLHLVVINAEHTIGYMKQTLPLGVFLVRKKYDYLHGTSYVDSAEIAPVPIKKSK